MSTISEFALIKECIENPLTLDKAFSQLNLQFIRDPNEKESGDRYAQEGSTSESNQRKAMRLFYLVWSGVTKCLVNIVQKQQKAIEIPGFAIFGPILEKNQGTRDPMDKGVKNKLAAIKLGIVPVFVVFNDDFIETMGEQVKLD